MTEVLFYHLTEHSLEHALPGLLERCLEREWRVVIQVENDSGRDKLDKHLWSYQAGSFLPHGAEGNTTEEPQDHPIWITTSDENPNEAQVRFVVDGSNPGALGSYDRVVFMFDGRDENAVVEARKRWKIEKDAGHELTYWQQDEEGRWAKKA